MDIRRHDTRLDASHAAACHGADLLRQAVERNGEAIVMVATGMSQADMLAALVAEPGIDWGRVTGFHLDEYVGLPGRHPASFRRYLKERFVSRVPLREFHFVSGEGDPAAECRRLAALIAPRTVDVAFIGIGENGHIAFNDPPADFETQEPYLVVTLDEACRRQQLGEGWFPSLEDVPTRAISMSCAQILKAASIVCTVPDARKAVAVKAALEGPVTPFIPASILRRHPDATVFLDRDSSALLRPPSVDSPPRF